jgi:hypothetical protein
VSASHPYLNESILYLPELETIDMSDIYVGDSIEKEIYFTNPFTNTMDKEDNN